MKNKPDVKMNIDENNNVSIICVDFEEKERRNKSFDCENCDFCEYCAILEGDTQKFIKGIKEELKNF